jgi:hypothetical protein
MYLPSCYVLFLLFRHGSRFELRHLLSQARLLEAFRGDHDTTDPDSFEGAECGLRSASDDAADADDRLGLALRRAAGEARAEADAARRALAAVQVTREEESARRRPGDERGRLKGQPYVTPLPRL